MSRFCALLVCLVIVASHARAEMIFVVERERGKVARIVNNELVAELSGLGDLRHAFIKFHNGQAYLLSRDGFLTRLDVASGRVTAKQKVGTSSIGLTFVGPFTAVANYDPKDVVILDDSLRIVKRIATGSRNVGIKSVGNRLIFSLMDKDAIMVVSCAKDKGCGIERSFKNVGDTPFDAMLADSTYIAGFFKGGALGVLDVPSLKYRTVGFTRGAMEIPLKIPHFGMWGVAKGVAYVPAVGEERVYIYDLDEHAVIDRVPLAGQPVFVVAAPDEKYVAINYSGKTENILTFMETKHRTIAKSFVGGKRIMHMRFSHDSKKLYVSSYHENAVHVYAVGSWKRVASITVPTPSGIFLAPE